MSKARTMTLLIAALAVMLAGCGRQDVRPVTAESEAERLRESHDCIYVYAVSNRFEVWDIGKYGGHLRTAYTLHEARGIVDAYYVYWAKILIAPPRPVPTPPGRKVE